MKKTYVFYVIFAIMAALGSFMLLGLAGSSDLGFLSWTELFIRGGLCFALASVGFWGLNLCSPALSSRKQRAKPCLSLNKTSDKDNRVA